MVAASVNIYFPNIELVEEFVLNVASIDCLFNESKRNHIWSIIIEARENMQPGINRWRASDLSSGGSHAAGATRGKTCSLFQARTN